MPDLPDPKKILEELGDKVASQIDQQAPVAFDASFREMTRYHRFLLAINASRTPDGDVFSYAEVQGNDWSAPHDNWISPYRKLFERAASRIPDNGEFISKLAYAPNRLLPKPGDPAISPTVTEAILDLGPIMVHRLEAWITKRTTLETEEGEAAKPRLRLAGSDQKSYQSVLPNIVGAWESLLHHVPSMYGWKERTENNDRQIWSTFQAAWPFLWRHLSNTSYCLALAVWNEDKAATKLFGESLARWSNELRHHFNDRYNIRRAELLFPDILELEWDRAREQVHQLSFNYSTPPSPDQVFWAVVRSAHDDAVNLTSAQLLLWAINKKQSSNIGETTARALLRSEGNTASLHSSAGQDPSFKSLFIGFIRSEILGNDFSGTPYATKLDKFVRKLDNMTERTVVPGRLYTPSTLQSRRDLRSSVVGILLGAVPCDGDGGVVRRMKALAKEFEILPQGDRSLRGLVNELDGWDSLLKEPFPWLENVAHLFDQAKDTNKAIVNLRKIIAAAKKSIEEVREERIKQLPIDEQQLEYIRLSIERALLNAPLETDFFHEVQVEASVGEVDSMRHEVPFGRIAKGELTKPRMASLPNNFEEYFVSTAQREAGAAVWNAFCSKDRTLVEVEAPVESMNFWKELRPLVNEIGSDPVLVVSNAAQERLFDIVYSDHPHLSVEFLPRGQRHSFYIATIEGVDVCGSGFEPGEAWLFSASSLKKIVYAKASETDKYIEMSIDLAEDLKVDLSVGFRQKFEWTSSPVFEIHGPDPEAGETVPEG